MCADVEPPTKRLRPAKAPGDGRSPGSGPLFAAKEPTEEDQKKRVLLLQPAPLKKDDVSKILAPEEEDDRANIGVQQYHCDACKKDVSNMFRVRCGECQDFDLCITCFSAGVETGSHRNDHSYIPVGRNDFSVFTPDWNADEEIILLEGVSKFGFGNWAEVAELIAPYNNKSKTKEECEQHYYSVHVLPYKAARPPPLPEDEAARRAEIQERMIGRYHHPVSQPIKPSPASSGGTGWNVVGFMPLRGDFDVEYDNDAELILSDMEFRGDEHPQERELKLKVLDIYNARVDERVLRKKVVIEKGLVDFRRLQQLGRRRTKEEIDLHNLFRLLVRYDVERDYTELANLFLTERRVRRRLHQLQEWQSLGFETFEEVEEKATRNQQTRRPTTDSSPADGVEERSCKFSLEAPAAEYPGASLLTEKELEFCDALQIPPIYFMFTKHSLLNSIIQNKPDQLILPENETLRLDAIKHGGLFDFVLHAKFELPTPTKQVPIIPVTQIDDQNNLSPSVARKTRARRKLAQQQQVLDDSLSASEALGPHDDEDSIMRDDEDM